MSTRTLKHLRVLCCSLTLIFWALYCAYYGALGKSVLVYYLAVLGFAVSSCEACIFDSQIVGRPVLTSLRAWMLLFYPVGVPAYLIIVRGWRGLLLAAGIWISFSLLGSLITQATYKWLYPGW